MGEKPISGEFSRGGTGTKQSGTGTTLVLSTGTSTSCSVSDQLESFGHNLLISYPI